MKKIVVNRLITIIPAYSAMKMRAKGPELYSVLNPETSSDSPSAKSNGVRLVSARVVVNQVANSGRRSNSGGVDRWKTISEKFIDKSRIRAPSKIRAILTS